MLGDEDQCFEARECRKTECRHCARDGQPHQRHRTLMDPEIGRWVDICERCGLVEPSL